jgi:hypothetical protein
MASSELDHLQRAFGVLPGEGVETAGDDVFGEGRHVAEVPY